MRQRILALETSGTSGSVAALEGERLLGEFCLDPALRSACSLAPGLSKLLAEVGWRPRDVQLVAVTAGPGSFTGLRVGVTTAKSFAYAVGAEVLGVNTLEVLAEQAPSDARVIKAVIDAQRQELFAATFQREPAVPSSLSRRLQAAGEILSIEAWLTALAPDDCVIGPALTKLLDRLPDYVRAPPEQDWMPKAASVGLIALRRFAAGERDDIWRLAPLYLRRSAAEEKAEAQTPPGGGG
jgi:tRNA threonylcarbamoyladenosine biosynthesis protein TsaB